MTHSEHSALDEEQPHRHRVELLGPGAGTFATTADAVAGLHQALPGRAQSGAHAVAGRVPQRGVRAIQYDETTTRVHRRPLVVVPAQINKYYITDLGPGRRLVESVVAAGILRRKESGADAGRLVADAPLCPGRRSRRTAG